MKATSLNVLPAACCVGKLIGNNKIEGNFYSLKNFIMLIYDEKSKTFIYKDDDKIISPNIFEIVFLLAPFSPFGLFVDLVKIINSSGKLSTDDAENINKIIEEGRKQNVAEMEIEVSRDVAMGINIANFNGNDVTIGTKGKTKYIIKVKYK